MQCMRTSNLTQIERGIQKPVSLVSTRYDWLGRMLDNGQSATWIQAPLARWQRIRRKRFQQKLRGDGLDACRNRIMATHEGRTLDEAIRRWASGMPVTVPMPAIEGGGSGKRASIIINTDNRAQELAVTLAALEFHGLDEQDELIVVIGPTEDQSGQVVDGSPLPIKRLCCPERNLAMSRNIGLREAAGEFVVHLDDDASPMESWLEGLLAPFVDPNVMVVAGHVITGEGERLLNRHVVADVLGGCTDHADAESAARAIRAFGKDKAFLTATGCNMALRKKPLLQLGGYDLAYAYFLEETDAVRRLLLAGGSCVAATGSRVLHRCANNDVRGGDTKVESVLVLLASHLHYVGKFGIGKCSPEELERSVWIRLFGDLERVCWDANSSQEASDKQDQYIQMACKVLDKAVNS